MLSYYSPQARQTSTSLPAWVHQQRYSYPNHQRHTALISAFNEAQERHGELIKALQFGYANQEPSNPQWVKSIEETQQQREAAKEVLDQARIELENYVNHSPEVRILLYQDEVKRLTPLLEEARQRQIEYTQELLNDPTASERRLARQIDGDMSGGEYSPQQLAELRFLKDNVGTIEAKISQCEQDIESIHALVAKAEKEAEIKSAMNRAMPRFELACSELRKAWAEIRNIAHENGIYFDEEQPRLPTGVRFKQSKSQNEGQSVIRLNWE